MLRLKTKLKITMKKEPIKSKGSFSIKNKVQYIK